MLKWRYKNDGTGTAEDSDIHRAVVLVAPIETFYAVRPAVGK